MNHSVDQALEHWQREGLLTAGKADELRASLGDVEHQLPNRAIRIFSAVGGLLVGLGIILFVASNWGDMTPVSKVALLLAAVLGTGTAGYWLAYERDTYVRTGQALLLVNVLAFGASIFLVGQIYHLPLNFWWGMLLWWAGTAFMAYALESRLHLWLSVPLLACCLGWLRQRAVFGFSEFDFLFDGRSSLLTLLPVFGVGCVALSVLHRRWARLDFGTETWMHWGIFLTLLTPVAATIDRDTFYMLLRFSPDAVMVGTAVGAALLAIGAMLAGRFRTPQGRSVLLGLALYVAFLHILAAVPVWIGFPGTEWGGYPESAPMLSALHVLHILLVFVALLAMTWYGTLLRSAAMINLGIAGLGIAVVLQYFSWIFSLLNRSLAFIAGGLLILGLSAVLERKRRDLLTHLLPRKR